MEGKNVEDITEDSLNPGDILFSVGEHGPDHALIYVRPKNDNSHLTVAHADFVKHEKLLKTSLPTGKYVVWRCNDHNLAAQAARLADNWASYATPYDSRRLYLGQDVYDELIADSAPTDLTKAMEGARKDFDSIGKYELLKYAARAGSSICRPDEDSEKARGVRCAMFVLICYQTAALLQADLVKPIVGDGQHNWVSNKYHDHAKIEESFAPHTPPKSKLPEYARFKRLQNTAIENYKSYVEKIRSREEFSGFTIKDPDHKLVVEDHALFSSALEAWDFKNGDIQNFDFKPYLSDALMLEQKTVNPIIFERALSEDQKLWENPFKGLGDGMLNVEAKSFTEVEKKGYQKELEKHLQNSESNKQQMISYINGDLNEAPTYADLNTSRMTNK
ncbi:MAG: hypothetical protein M3R00_07225 [Pseudomonadota bacterium]|nr:hypothetical protein [Pseudomonadota bacterium]